MHQETIRTASATGPLIHPHSMATDTDSFSLATEAGQESSTSGDGSAQSGGGSPALGSQKSSTSKACRGTGGENDQRRAGTLKSKKAPARHQIHGCPCSSSSSPRHPGRPARGKAAEGHRRSMRRRTYSRSSRRHRPPPRHPTMGLLRSTTRTATRRRAWAPDAEELTGIELETGSCHRPSFPRHHGRPKKGAASIRRIRA
jgi:hypothetical protein